MALTSPHAGYTASYTLNRVCVDLSKTPNEVCHILARVTLTKDGQPANAPATESIDQPEPGLQLSAPIPYTPPQKPEDVLTIAEAESVIQAWMDTVISTNPDKTRWDSLKAQIDSKMSAYAAIKFVEVDKSLMS